LLEAADEVLRDKGRGLLRDENVAAVGEPDATGKRPPIYVKEEAPWSAMRNAALPE
jgi:hypothetical protein